MPRILSYSAPSLRLVTPAIAEPQDVAHAETQTMKIKSKTPVFQVSFEIKFSANNCLRKLRWSPFDRRTVYSEPGSICLNGIRVNPADGAEDEIDEKIYRIWLHEQERSPSKRATAQPPVRVGFWLHERERSPSKTDE